MCSSALSELSTLKASSVQVYAKARTMAFKKHHRQYDLVLFGATGYTGLMTAEHIALHLPTDLRWAIAGRSVERLQNVVRECHALNPDRRMPEIEVWDLNDADLAALAKKTFILITTAGPFAKYGEDAFKACAETGTHYFDCTGEAVWTQEMIQKYEATAKSTGACMIPQCGIESAPSDLITYLMASLIRSELSASTSDVVVDFHEVHAAPSGGSLETALGLFDVYSWKQISESHEPYALSPVANTTVPPKPSLLSRLTGVRYIPNLGLLTTSFAAGTNTAIVTRTWGLTKQEPALHSTFYGPKFTYQEYMKARSFLPGVFLHYVQLIGGALLMFCPPFRTLLRRFIYKPGEGPSREEGANNYFEVRGVATPDADSSARKQALCRAWYSGSMYYLTGILLAQAACTLLQDDAPLEGAGGGIYTPACLGQEYIDRVHQHGFKFEAKIVDA
ncbi:hypothetical protein DL765_006393 [Monosporascus sp. GIB2]|nr:hypothetical protein DL765_006393 [Monosporascus sp. GIB2]